MAEEGWEGVSDAGEPGASGEDAEGDGWVASRDFHVISISPCRICGLGHLEQASVRMAFQWRNLCRQYHPTQASQPKLHHLPCRALCLYLLYRPIHLHQGPFQLLIERIRFCFYSDVNRRVVWHAAENTVASPSSISCISTALE